MSIITSNSDGTAIIIWLMNHHHFILQSSHMLQQAGFATIPNAWDFVWETSASCWGNQYIWHWMTYLAVTRGLNVNVAMVATGKEVQEVQHKRVGERIVQSVECKSVISKYSWCTCTYVYCWHNVFILQYVYGGTLLCADWLLTVISL